MLLSRVGAQFLCTLLVAGCTSVDRLPPTA